MGIDGCWIIVAAQRIAPELVSAELGIVATRFRDGRGPTVRRRCRRLSESLKHNTHCATPPDVDFTSVAVCLELG